MRKMMLATRLRLAVVLMLVGFVLLVLVLSSRASDRLLDVKMLTTVEQVKQAQRIAQEQYDQAKSGAISEAQAKSAAAAVIGKIRYSGNEYLWINDMDVRMVMHPIKPELNGQDLRGNKDPDGKALFVAMVDTVKASSAGYVDYLWPKPGAKDPEPKRSYVAGFAPWGWVIGSGVYVTDVRALAHQDALFTMALVAGAGLLAFAGVEWFARSMRRRLGMMRDVMHAVAAGDLCVDIEVGAADEVGLVLRQVVLMQQRLTEMVRQIREATESIGHASSEVAVGSQDLSTRTEQTAANLQQAAASMQELTQQVRQSAQAADQSFALAGVAAGQAKSGAAVMSEVVRTMGGISESSRKITDIINVIDGVAFQTNILALNAAVEAARAGEQGRGFAVVAAEVRSLAQRSAQAAKEIKTLITDSTERVQAGNQQVDHAGTAMGEILGAVERVTTTVGEIKDVSAQQSQGIALINEAVVQLDNMTQQNAALVEETAAAAEALKQQAVNLNATVAVFKIHAH